MTCRENSFSGSTSFKTRKKDVTNAATSVLLVYLHSLFRRYNNNSVGQLASCTSLTPKAQLPLSPSRHGNTQYLIFGYLWRVRSSTYSCSALGHTRNDQTFLEHHQLSKVSRRISLLCYTVGESSSVLYEHSMWSTGKSKALPPETR